MLNAIQTAFKNFWQNIIKPGLIFIAIGAVIWAIGLAVGLSGFGDADRKLETFRSESIEERQRIDGINSQVRVLKARLGELNESNRKLKSGFISIGGTLDRLSIASGNNLEQLRRIIESITEIQAIIKGLGDT